MNNNTINNTVLMNEEEGFKLLEKILEYSAGIIIKKGGQSYITRIMNIPDSEVYDEILTSLEHIKATTVGKVIDSTKGLFRTKKPNKDLFIEVSEIIELQDSLKASVEEVIDKATDKATVIDRIKALAVLVFKKAVALLKGIASFTFDATTILGATMGRVNYQTAREIILGGKAESNYISNNGIWNLISCVIELDNNPYYGPQVIEKNFYIGSPACPHCNRSMFKTVFPIGEEYKIDTSRGVVQIKRVFTCPLCKVFFAPIPGNRISDGMLFERKFLSESDYKEVLVDMDKCGSLKGRGDL